MARRLRYSPGGIAYHVMNRAVRGLRLFADDADYAAFEGVLAEARRRVGMRLCGYTLMPNHFHLVLWPRGDGDLSAFMQWLTMTHVQRWHAHRRSAGRGHIYQSRFKSFPVQRNARFLAACRYVEANPLRAGLVRRAEDWPWGSLACRVRKLDKAKTLLADWPVARPARWLALVNAAQAASELEALRESADRGKPFGEPGWVARMADRLGLASTLRPRGRPKGEGN